jgi:hypothetical protein
MTTQNTAHLVYQFLRGEHIVHRHFCVRDQCLIRIVQGMKGGRASNGSCLRESNRSIGLSRCGYLVDTRKKAICICLLIDGYVLFKVIYFVLVICGEGDKPSSYLRYCDANVPRPAGIGPTRVTGGSASKVGD